MTLADFLAEVAQPNMAAALTHPNDARAIVNAVLSLDALAGIIHADGIGSGSSLGTGYKTDADFRDALADASRSFRILRDLAASLKHGLLEHKKPRLLREATALQKRRKGLGIFHCGDSLGGEVVVVEIEAGPGFVRASSVVAASYRMLKRVVEGGPAQEDDEERATFAADDGSA